MSLQDAIVGLAVAGALLYVARRAWRTFSRRGGAGCGCGPSCSSKPPSSNRPVIHELITLNRPPDPKDPARSGQARNN